jgi:hypothetical protein
MADAVGLEVEGGCRSLLAVPHCSGEGDLFAGVERGPNRLFRNENGHYDPTRGGALADPAGDTRGAALVDEGGTFAFAIGNEDGPNRLLRHTPVGGFEDVAPEPLREPGRVRTVVAADFDNDGREELFYNVSGEPNRLYRRVGGDGSDGADDASRWEPVDPGSAAEPDGFGTGAVAADLDGDGVLELVVVHGEVAAQPMAVYEVAGAADAGWLRVRPTTRHGAPARGAVVRLETTAGIQRRTIDAGGGCLCQTEPVAHFGLGGATPRRIVVRWPDGRERVLSDPPPDTEIAVEHPSQRRSSAREGHRVHGDRPLGR